MIGEELVQLPLLVVRVSPSSALPETTGDAVFTGAILAETIAVGPESVEPLLPSVFSAITTERRLWPTSALVGMYVR